MQQLKRTMTDDLSEFNVFYVYEIYGWIVSDHLHGGNKLWRF